MKSKHYGAIDGLRTLACLGILMMHIKANNSYQIDGYLYNTIIPSFTNFVFLFMTISSFGMCCGYYNKVINKEIDWNSFYLNRFKKILPFFSFLVLIDFVMNPSLNSLYESFANITLLFGLLPNAGNIEVIGVGWFLGLIFVFYLIFPFFTTLLQSKKKAWITFLISIIYNFVCTNYFNVSRSNILYSSMFFMAGGLVFLYKEELERINKPLVYLLVLLSIIVYYLIGGNSFGCLLVSVALLILAIVTRGGLLDNQVAHFISSISMEIYLSHMVIFRVIEKVHLNTMIKNDVVQYVVTVLLVTIGTIIFSYICKRVIKFIEDKLLIKV